MIFQVQSGLLASLVTEDHKAFREFSVLPDRQDHQASLVHVAIRVPEVLPDLPGMRVPREC